VDAGKLELDTRDEQVKANTAAGGWGSSGSWAPAIPLKELVDLKGNLRGTEQRHRKLLQDFLRGLPEAANEVSTYYPGALEGTQSMSSPRAAHLPQPEQRHGKLLQAFLHGLPEAANEVSRDQLWGTGGHAKHVASSFLRLMNNSVTL
jgi:hypothetical protein